MPVYSISKQSISGCGMQDAGGGVSVSSCEYPGSSCDTRKITVPVGVSLIVFAIYYLCLAGARSVCETGALPPEIGVWVPDLFLLIACIHLFRRVAREQSISLLPGFLRHRSLNQMG